MRRLVPVQLLVEFPVRGAEVVVEPAAAARTVAVPTAEASDSSDPDLGPADSAVGTVDSGSESCRQSRTLSPLALWNPQADREIRDMSLADPDVMWIRSPLLLSSG